MTLEWRQHAGRVYDASKLREGWTAQEAAQQQGVRWSRTWSPLKFSRNLRVTRTSPVACSKRATSHHRAGTAALTWSSSTAEQLLMGPAPLPPACLRVALGAGALDEACKVLLHLGPPQLRRCTGRDVAPHHVPARASGTAPTSPLLAEAGAKPSGGGHPARSVHCATSCLC